MVTLTQKAVVQIKKIQSEDPSAQGAALRLQVVGGGCSGMSYKMSFEKLDQATQAQNGDTCTEIDGVTVVIDQKSGLFLKDMEVDFSDGLNGTGFTFNNPNAKRTCGCGTSFSA